MNILLKAFQFSLLKTFDKAISNLENFQLKDFLFHDLSFLVKTKLCQSIALSGLDDPAVTVLQEHLFDI